MANFSNRLKSIEDKAKEYDWSPRRIRTLVEEGLPVVEIGRQSLINDDTFDQYLKDR